MIRKAPKTRKYFTPKVWVVQAEFEKNFCNSIITLVEVDRAKSIGLDDKADEGTYFEF